MSQTQYGFQESITLFDTWDLLDLLRDDRAAPPDAFWLNLYPNQILSESKKIVFEDLPFWDRRMAPFVMPHMEGRVMRDVAYPGLKDFEPAYVKPKHAIEAAMTIPRMMGEPLGGNLSRQERFDRLTAARLLTQRNMISRRWDWMAAQGIIYGYCDVIGEDYAPVRVDFQRPANLTMILAGTATWNNYTPYQSDSSPGTTTCDPLGDIVDMKQASFRFGRSPTNNVAMGLTAWKWFRQNPTVRELLKDSRYFNLGPQVTADLTGFGSGEPVQKVATIQTEDGGITTFWTYNNQYEDPMDGILKDVLDTCDVVGWGDGVQGCKAFGAIEDFDAGLAATDMFPKQWVERGDIGRAFVMTQSAPLMVPVNAKNTWRIRVGTDPNA